MSAVTENLLIEAVGQGLGAVWMAVAPFVDRQQNVAYILGLPSSLEAFSLVAVGHPADAVHPKGAGRYDETRIHRNYLFYSCTNLASVNGLGNLSGVRSMRYTFSSCAFTTIDFRGFDPSALTDLFYTFSGCSHMTTIYADATWALPTRGISGSQCFYSCGSLVGGNGTAWASSKTAYTYFRIDTARAGVSDGCLVVYTDVSAIEYRTAVPARNTLSPTQRQRSVPPRRDAW